MINGIKEYIMIIGKDAVEYGPDKNDFMAGTSQPNSITKRMVLRFIFFILLIVTVIHLDHKIRKQKRSATKHR